MKPGGPAKRILVLFVSMNIVILPFCASRAAAGWVDDWLAQKTSDAPGHFEGQKRDYFTGGHLSARWPHRIDHPVTLEMPKFKFGCGGIDAFMGSFSYLNSEYLMRKLQRILAASPTYAFQIGLKMLCEDCASEIESLEGIINTLNKVQLDDCKAAKAMVVSVADGVGVQNEKIPADMQNAAGDFLSSSGMNDLYKRFQELQEGSGGERKPDENAKTALNEMFQGCPAVLNHLFRTGGSFLLNAANQFGINPAHVPLMRGLAGDIEIRIADDFRITSGPVPPCSENGLSPFQNFVTGAVYVRNRLDGPCEPMTDENKNLDGYVKARMVSIVEKMQSKNPLTGAEEALINELPLPVFSTLKMAVMTGQTSSLLGTLSNYSAKIYARNIAADLMSLLSAAIHEARRAAAGAVAGNDAAEKSCKPELVIPIIQEAERLRKTISTEGMPALQKDYEIALREINEVYNIAGAMQRYDTMARKAMTERFGPAVAERSMGRR